jgi:hypothetical protein
MKREIVVSFQPELLPVLRRLPQDKYGITAIQPQFAKLLSDAGVPTRSLFEVLNEADQSVAARASVNLNTVLHSTKYDTDILPEPSKHIIEDDILARYFYQRLPDITLIISALSKLNPALIVGHNDVEPLLRLAALWAKSHHVPFLHVPHAIYLDTDDRGPRIGYDIHDLVTASHLAAGGPYQAQWYRDRDRDLQIFVTGLPQFDRLAGRKRDKHQARKLLRLDEAKPVLVYMSSWRQDTNLLGCHDGVEEAYTNTLLAVKDIPDMQLVVKCHPRGNNTQWHIEQANKLGVRCIVTHEHLDVTLMVADLVLSYGASNVVLEAATIPEIRLLAINGFANDPAVITCDEHIENIRAALVHAMTNPPANYDALLAKYLGPLDGKAHERIANLIMHIAPGNANA